jgi:hypothetical protein
MIYRVGVTTLTERVVILNMGSMDWADVVGEFSR